MSNMSFRDGNQVHAPLMIWGLAIDTSGIVYMTTYVQVSFSVATRRRPNVYQAYLYTMPQALSSCCVLAQMASRWEGVARPHRLDRSLHTVDQQTDHNVHY